MVPCPEDCSEITYISIPSEDFFGSVAELYKYLEGWREHRREEINEVFHRSIGDVVEWLRQELWDDTEEVPVREESKLLPNLMFITKEDT